MKSKQSILRARARAKFQTKLTTEDIRKMTEAIYAGLSYNAAGKLVGVSASSAKYWFMREGK